ncbi:MAG: hypothetical protein ACRC7H_07495 [Plesiomonas shigelloides]
MNISIIGIFQLPYKQFTHLVCSLATRLQLTYSTILTVIMGQIFGKSDEAHSFDDRSDVYHQGTDEEVDLFWATAPSTAYAICDEDPDEDLFWSSKLKPSIIDTSREPYEEVDFFWKYTPGPPTINMRFEGDEEDLFWSSREGQDKRDQTPEVVALPADRHGDGK